jgi:hypothetical protein
MPYLGSGMHEAQPKDLQHQSLHVQVYQSLQKILFCYQQLPSVSLVPST